jgi:hypothetical protein
MPTVCQPSRLPRTSHNRAPDLSEEDRSRRAHPVYPAPVGAAVLRAVFFNRLGEIRDRSFDQQRYRSSGLDLLTAAIILWNTVYPAWYS